MNLSDHVRALLLDTVVIPARRSGQHIVSVAVSDLSRHLGWKNRFPLICGALTRKAFLHEEGLEIERVSDPCPSSTVIFTFRLA